MIQRPGACRRAHSSAMVVTDYGHLDCPYPRPERHGQRLESNYRASCPPGRRRTSCPRRRRRRRGCRAGQRPTRARGPSNPPRHDQQVTGPVGRACVVTASPFQPIPDQSRPRQPPHWWRCVRGGKAPRAIAAHCRPGWGWRFSGPNSSTQKITCGSPTRG